MENWSLCLFYSENKDTYEASIFTRILIQLIHTVHLICTINEVLVWIFSEITVQVLVPTWVGLQMRQHYPCQRGIPLYLCLQVLLFARQELQDLGC